MLDPASCGELRDLFEGSLIFREPMSLHTSWRIGGPAEVFAEPRGVEGLKVILKYACRLGIPVTVIGAGTNILVKDGGIKGIVIQVGSGLSDIKIDGQLITAGGGLRLSRLVSAVRDAGIGGFEFIAGIPGTVGGAVVMNAGAYGSSVSDLVSRVTCIDFTGEELHLENGQMEWGYRKSALQGKNLIAVEAVFVGSPRDRDLIAADMEKYISSRKAKQPLEYPNSGSVFKNPPGNYAGKLIDEAGCRGMRVGDAQVSVKHTNFIVNLGKATAGEVLDLIAAVKSRVLERSGINLELEVKVLGWD
ncbi:MAG: UDP-N-acetylenolpyruvoylglucosamine reductase [Peptococcaceae bacterium BRH_c4a]|nr:MAG: UDP-N-acetylenolpyruvoylglucosamine reductase [Peptococcaceae bacterium BRH_c4a]